MSNKKNTSVANANDKEFSTGSVPVNERRGFFSLVFTWIGYVFTVTIMSAGGQLANGASSFGESMKAVYVGYAILFCIAMATSTMAMRTGLSFGLLTRYTFGRMGAKAITLLSSVALCCYFSINCYLMGDITHVLFPVIPRWPITIIFGILMIFSALKGQKIMNIVGLFATVAVFAVGIVAVVLAFRDAHTVHPDGMLAITKEASMTFTALVTIAVGSVCSGCCSWAPDIMRFSKGPGTTTAVMGVGLGICGPFMLLIGICGMMVYGEYDIAYILQKQGFLSLAFVGLVANIWSTAQGNAYSTSLNLASVFPHIKREKLLVIFGCVGTVMGLFGLYQHFGTFLSFLATVYPPLAGTVLANYIVAWRANPPKLEDANDKLPAFTVISLVIYVIGVTSKWWLRIGGIPAVNALVLTFVLEALLSYACLRKKADGIRTEIAAAND